MRNTTPVISIFSGAGGLDLAFNGSGAFETILAVEMEPIFCETLKENIGNKHSNTEIVCSELKDARDQIEARAVEIGGGNFGIIGGPPCQSFSTMGRRSGFSDANGSLFGEFVDLIIALRPKFFLIENVPAILSEKQGHKAGFLAYMEKLSSEGFTVSYDILCAADYGAATSRKRMICVGFDISEVMYEFPQPTHSKTDQLVLGMPTSPWVGSWEVLKDLPCPFSDEASRYQAHIGVNHTAAVIERFETLKPGGYDYGRKRPRLHPEEPCKSLVAGNFGGTRNPIHPVSHRELTNREIARIQGFDDDFYFAGNFAQVGKQIANAVPIKLGRAVADSIARSLAETSGADQVAINAGG
jgi:DNA (cytosine-5)-methyltransferase 1